MRNGTGSKTVLTEKVAGELAEWSAGRWIRCTR